MIVRSCSLRHLAVLLAALAMGCSAAEQVCDDGVTREVCQRPSASPSPSPSPTPSPTMPPAPDGDCDGVDDDGDGEIDEGFVPAAISCGVGACASTGMTSCAGGQLSDDCTPGPAAASDTTCDGVDDDCDGTADQGFVSVPTMCGADACAMAGRTTCVGGMVVDSCAPGGADAIPAPLARTDHYSVEVGGTLDVPAPGVLANDSYGGSAPIVAIQLGDTTTGTVTAFGADGSFSYRAPERFEQPGLEPVVAWRNVTDISGFAQAIDFDADGVADPVYSRYGALRALDGRTGNVLWDADTAITTEANAQGCSGFFSGQTVATGVVDASGDVLAVQSYTCGLGDRFIAWNGSRAVNGRVGPRWISPPLTVPHPGVYANSSAPGPITPPGPPPNIHLTQYAEPTLARLELGGGVKLLAHRTISASEGSYPTGGFNGGGFPLSSNAACRAATGIPSDENRACRVTWILDATTGAVEHVLTAPNPSNEAEVGSRRPWRQNAPIAADLDGDGAVEIIAGSDVWRRTGSRWTLAWQTPYLPTSVAVADLDGDGTAEVIQHQLRAGRPEGTAGIFIYAADGTLRRRIASYPDDGFVGTLTVADADADGQPDILHLGYGFVFAHRSDGRPLWTFAVPDRPETLPNGLTSAAVPLPFRSGQGTARVYDLDLDGKPEVIVAGASRLFILDGRTGAELWSIDHEGHADGVQSLLLGDADRDGHVDILTLGHDRWNCSVITGGPVPCVGSALAVGSARRDWAPAPPPMNQLQYRPGAVDDGGRILYDPSIRRDFGVPQQLGTAVDPRTRQGASFGYSASACQASSAEATVFIEVRPPNSPPVITSRPPTALLSVAPYTRPIYRVTATDPDPGDVVTFELEAHTHPIGQPYVTITSSTGEIAFYTGPCGSFGGPCIFDRPVAVTVAAVDSAGARTVQTFMVEVTNVVAKVPNVVGQPLDAAIAALQAASLLPRVVAEQPDASPAGTVLAQDPAPRAPSIPAGAAVDLTISSGPPGGLPPPPDGLVSMRLELPSGTIVADTYVQLTAWGTLADGVEVDLTRSVAWSSSDARIAAISAVGLARGRTPGTVTLAARTGMVTASVMLTVLERVGNDMMEPRAEVGTPAIGARIAAPIDVIGTVSDPNLLRWELSTAPSGSADFTPIASGTSPVQNAALGRFDPTLLLNGEHTLRLTVTDLGGNEAVTDRTVIVEGAMKVGHFTVAFEDLAIPMSGLPIEIRRTYDSRDHAVGDFGVGWRLGIDTLRVQTNRPLGTGWERQVSGANVTLVATDEHRVTIVLPSGRVEVFDMDVSPTTNLGSLDATRVTGFTARPGTIGRLEVLGDTDLFITAAGNEDVLTDETIATYDPRRFRYTAYDGTEIVVHATSGVETVREINGNTLTFGANGVIHSAGLSILFGRDALGRITRITDPRGFAQTYAYDARGDLVAHTDPEGNVTRFAYDASHRLLSIEDPLRRVVARNDYDASGRLIGVTDAAGNRSDFTHDLAARREIVTDALGNATIHAYDAAGNVVEVTSPIGAVRRYTYDARGNELTETDPLGRVWTRTYDAAGEVTSEVDPLGNRTTYTRDARGVVIGVVDPLGRSSSSVPDARGNVVSHTNALGELTRMSYDGAGNLTRLIDARGGTTELSYDAAGRRTRIVDPAGSIAELAHDASGNLTGQVVDSGPAWALEYDGKGQPTEMNVGAIDRSIAYDAAGQMTGLTTPRATGTLSYDARGLQTSVSGPRGTLVAVTYDAVGRVASYADGLGNVTQLTRDAAGRVTAVRHPDGSTETRTYDLADQLVAMVDPLGNTWSFEYDAAGRRTRTVDPLGGATVEAYDAAGQRVSVTDPMGRVTSFEHDALGRVIRTVLPGGGAIVEAYDAAGNVVSRTDAGGGTTAFEHDAAGRVIRVVDALGNTTRYEHDASGAQTARIDASGRRTTFARDAQGRLTTTTLPGGGVTTLGYAADGTLASRTDARGEVVAYGYDASGALTSITTPGGAIEARTYTTDGLLETVTRDGGTTRYAYDPSSRRLTRVTEPDGRYVRYAYDALGRRTLMAHAMATGAAETITSYEHDAAGRLSAVIDASGGRTTYTRDLGGAITTIVRPNGVRTGYTHDAAGRVVSVAHTNAAGMVLFREDYTLDASGLRTRAQRSDGTRAEYDYDALDRLIAERHFDATGLSAGARTYAYDAVGSLVSQQGTGGTVAFTHDADDRVLTAGAATFAYDAAGNLIRATDTLGRVTEYGWDARGRLISVRPPMSGAYEYTYDHDGLRRTKRAPSGVTTHYLWDRAAPVPQLLRESDGMGTVVQTYLLGADRIAAGTAQIHADALGSTRLLTSAAGAVTDRYDYWAYGAARATSGSSTQPFRFAGEQLDPESGLYYLRARYYDPSLARFLGRDPAEGIDDDPRSRHPYSYAHDNPVMLTDPTGRETLISLLGNLQIRAQNAQLTAVRGYRAYSNAQLNFFRSLKLASMASIVFGILEVESSNLSRAYYGRTGRYAATALFFMELDMNHRRPDHYFDANKRDPHDSNVDLHVNKGPRDGIMFQTPNYPSVYAHLYYSTGFATQVPLPSPAKPEGHSMLGSYIHAWTHVALPGARDAAIGCNRAEDQGDLLEQIATVAGNFDPLFSEATGIFTAFTRVINPDSHRCYIQELLVGGGQLP